MSKRRDSRKISKGEEGAKHVGRYFGGACVMRTVSSIQF